MPASGSTDPHVRGIALFPEPGDFTASSAPCQGPAPRTEVPLPETRISPSQSACRREKRTLACPSGTQRVSHINITMSSAQAVAFPLRVATARWSRRQPDEYITHQTLCQVNSPAISSHAHSLMLPAPAGLTRRLNCALRGRELYGTRGVRARVGSDNRGSTRPVRLRLRAPGNRLIATSGSLSGGANRRGGRRRAAGVG